LHYQLFAIIGGASYFGMQYLSNSPKKLESNNSKKEIVKQQVPNRNTQVVKQQNQQFKFSNNTAHRHHAGTSGKPPQIGPTEVKTPGEWYYPEFPKKWIGFPQRIIGGFQLPKSGVQKRRES